MKKFNECLDKSYSVPGVYLIKINKHLYVGSSINVKTRLQQHINKLKKSKHENKYIQNRFDKYGVLKSSYCLLEKCNADLRLYKEKEWIDKLKPDLNSKLDPLNQNNSIRQSKIVYQYNKDGSYIQSFPSVSEAGRVLNIDSTSISNCCRKGLYKSTAGYM